MFLIFRYFIVFMMDWFGIVRFCFINFSSFDIFVFFFVYNKISFMNIFCFVYVIILLIRLIICVYKRMYIYFV